MFIVIFYICLFLKLVPSREDLGLVLLEENELPKLSLIITARNEESRLLAKLENTLKIDYPKTLLGVIVSSDFRLM